MFSGRKQPYKKTRKTKIKKIVFLVFTPCSHGVCRYPSAHKGGECVDEPAADGHVNRDSHDIVGHGDKGACRDSGVNLEALQHQGHHRAKQRGKHHHQEQRCGHRSSGDIGLGRIVIDGEEAGVQEDEQTHHQGIDQRRAELLE